LSCRENSTQYNFTAILRAGLAIGRMRNLTGASVIGVLWAAAMFAWFFLTALYLQLVLHYSPLRTGPAFLPANLVMGVISAGISAQLVSRAVGR
jgi:hypothetical protein